MLRDEFDARDPSSPEALRTMYETRLQRVVEEHGVDIVSEDADIDEQTLSALATGESPELTLEGAAAILAVESGTPDAESIRLEALDILLMGMTNAVLDVEAVAASIDAAVQPKDVQQKVEGRQSVTLEEYARLQWCIERER